MKFWLAVPFFALAQASCYDYEYYDPDTGSPIPGNACNKVASTTAGQPAVLPGVLPATQFQGAVQTGVIVPPTQLSPAVAPLPYSPRPIVQPALPTTGVIVPPTQTFSTGAIVPTTQTLATGLIVPPTQPYVVPRPTLPTVVQPATVYGPVTTNPIVNPVYGPVITQPTAVYGPSARIPSQVAVVGPSAPVVVRQQGAGQAAQVRELADDIQYYRRLGQEQAREHRLNQRDVSEASQDLSRASLVNRIVAGPGQVTSWFPIVRLGQQKRIAEAYRSEKQIANRNARDAYQRYQEDPSRLNLLVSKYQDLNADLRDSAYHYNVVNAGTFGQRVASTGLLGLGGGVFGGLTQILTQRRQSEDLQDIQRQMQRIARQIQQEARTAVGGAQAAQAQGSVQQRLMATTVYGPQRSG